MLGCLTSVTCEGCRTRDGCVEEVRIRSSFAPRMFFRLLSGERRVRALVLVLWMKLEDTLVPSRYA